MFRIRAVLALIGLLLPLLLPAPEADAGATRQAALPAGWKRLTWEGIVISYNPHEYRFEVTRPTNERARLAARLVQNPDPCVQVDPGGDCFTAVVTFQLFPNRDGDVRSWAARSGSLADPYSGSAASFIDTLIGGRQAVQYHNGFGMAGPETTYAVRSGSDIVVISPSAADERIVSLLQFAQPAADRLAVGRVAMTKLSSTWDLWTAPSGGVRIYERPQLLGGAFLTILAIRPQAVQVRTSEGVTGWIHAPAATALTTRAAHTTEHIRFIDKGAVVLAPRGLPLRTAPWSTAPNTATERLKTGQRVTVLGRRGDWLRVHTLDLPVNAIGWVRWQYDGARYMGVAAN